MHHFDNKLPTNLGSYTHFCYWSQDFGESCVFAKMSDPQGECILLHETEIYLPKVTYLFNSHETKIINVPVK